MINLLMNSSRGDKTTIACHTEGETTRDASRQGAAMSRGRFERRWPLLGQRATTPATDDRQHQGSHSGTTTTTSQPHLTPRRKGGLAVEGKMEGGSEELSCLPRNPRHGEDGVSKHA